MEHDTEDGPIGDATEKKKDLQQIPYTEEEPG